MNADPSPVARAAPNPRAIATWGPRLVTAAVMLVGVYDVLVGGVLLASSTPWIAHGPGTAWIALGATLQSAPLDVATVGLFRRMGAFSLHAGVCTIVWAGLAVRRPWLQTAQFFTYLATGIGFALTDAQYFAGTPYLMGKHIIGTVFFAAFLGHLALRRAERRSAT